VSRGLLPHQAGPSAPKSASAAESGNTQASKAP
jgi:hypothetical protein